MEATNNNQGYVFLGNAPELMKLLEDIFTDDFMQQHTRFENFDGFKFSSAVMVNWKADTIVYAPLLLDSFVKEMEAVFGAHSCNVLDIRPVGPACIHLGL